MPTHPYLPYGRQVIDGDDVEAVTRILRQDLLTTGPEVARFEAALAKRLSARHAVACTNGTAALHLAALALGLGPGDAVVVPAITFLATANAVRFVGAEVVFADVDPATGLLGPDHLAEALDRAGLDRPRAVIPVHLAGQPCDMAAIAGLAGERGLWVVEDACHAIGGTHADTPTGSCAHSAMACFSMHPVKAIAMGEGGAVTTNDDVLAARLARLRSHGMTRDPADFVNTDLAFDTSGAPNPWYYEMSEPGFNYRVSDINCALGLSQLGKLDRFLERRHHLASLYDSLLAPLAGILDPVPDAGHGVSGRHLYSVAIDFEQAGIDRATVMRRLHKRGIGTQVHYIPVHRQPYYRHRYGELELPGAERYYSRTLSLPLFPSMTDGDVERVAGELTSLLTG